MKNIFKPKSVSVSYKNIDLTNPKEKAKLMTQLKKKNVDALDLSNSKVQLDKEILEAIIENPISELDLSSNNLGDGGSELVAGIIQNSKLKILKLSNNQIGSEGMGALSSAFDHNETVTDLDLSNNNLGDNGAKEVAGIIQNNTKLKILKLSNNQIGSEGMGALSSAFDHNKTVTDLDLSNNNLGDNGAKEVAGIIQNNTKLKILKLSNNQIGSEGMGALSSAFDHNKTVTDLDLSNNNLGDKGAEKVATLLTNNSTIIDINLDNNEFGKDGLLHLPFSLLNRNNTTNISLAAANYIPEEAVARFAKVLQQNGNVHSINCVDKDAKEKYPNEIEVHAQKLFDTIIKIRDSNGLDKESQKEFNKLVWECIVPYPKWKDLFKDLVTDSKKPYLFDTSTLDTDGKPMLSKVSNTDIFSFVAKHESANKSKVVQQGELPPLDEKWFDRTVRVDDALPLENAAAQNVTESLLTSVAGNEGVKGAYARLNDIPDSPSLEQRMQARNLRDYLADTLTPSLKEEAEMRTIIGDHPDPLAMTILGNDNPDFDLLTRTIVHGQDVSTTDRLSSVAPKKAILEHKDNPKMQTEAKKLGETMSPYMASTSQSNATPNTPNTGKKHGQSSGFTR